MSSSERRGRLRRPTPDPIFIVLGVLFALVFAGLGVFALTTALFGDPLID